MNITMSVTSFWFFAMVGIGALIYYILPKRSQWVQLLILSVLFYCLAATPYTISYLVFSALTAYAATNILKNRHISRNERVKSAIVIAAITLNVVLWLLTGGRGLWIGASSIVHKVFHAFPKFKALPFVAAMGMGYYTVQVIGYILDCYWENSQPQRNPLKLLLFVCFFPQLTTGPISRYSQLEQLYEGHSFSYKNLAYGAQRILWGLLKKLVLAERMAVLINGIWAESEVYTGLWQLLAVLVYPVYIYSDFSGCMDIILGVAEIFGIHLPENFNNPFFSLSIQEFWQRWHITIGAWAKDYVLYPLLKTRAMVKLGKKTKKRFGKRIGKFIPTAVSMGVLWVVMGIWHGSLKYIVGVSFWYWALLMLGELFGPLASGIADKLHFKTDTFSWRLFQRIRTYIIYAVGALFFSLGSVSEAFAVLKNIFMMPFKHTANPWIFFDGSVLKLGLTYGDLNIIIFSVLLVTVADIIHERKKSTRAWMRKQCIAFRWLVWIALFIFVLIFAKYGPGYSAAEFIYQGF